MELDCSSHMSWEDEVQKEEEWQRHGSSDKGSPKSGSLPLALEEGNASDVSIGRQQPPPPSMTQMWLSRKRGKRA